MENFSVSVPCFLILLRRILDLPLQRSYFWRYSFGLTFVTARGFSLFFPFQTKTVFIRFASCQVYSAALISCTLKYLHGFPNEGNGRGAALAGYFNSYFPVLFAVAFQTLSLQSFYLFLWLFDAALKFFFFLIVYNFLVSGQVAHVLYKCKSNLLDSSDHHVKSIQIQTFFWSVFSQRQSKYGKIRTRETPYLDTFRSVDQNGTRTRTILIRKRRLSRLAIRKFVCSKWQTR